MRNPVGEGGKEREDKVLTVRFEELLSPQFLILSVRLQPLGHSLSKLKCRHSNSSEYNIIMNRQPKDSINYS